MNKKAVNIIFYISVILFIILFLIYVLFSTFGQNCLYINYRNKSNIAKIEQQINSQYLNNGVVDNGYSRYIGHDKQGIYLFEIKLFYNNDNMANQSQNERIIYVAYSLKDKKLIAETNTIDELMIKTVYKNNYFVFDTE